MNLYIYISFIYIYIDIFIYIYLYYIYIYIFEWDTQFWDKQYLRFWSHDSQQDSRRFTRCLAEFGWDSDGTLTPKLHKIWTLSCSDSTDAGNFLGKHTKHQKHQKHATILMDSWDVFCMARTSFLDDVEDVSESPSQAGQKTSHNWDHAPSQSTSGND